MSFHSYFVRLACGESQFTSTVFIDKKNFTADFKRIGPDIHMVFFRSQVPLTHLQELGFKRRRGSMRVLFPVLAKYNQRKLKKWAELLAFGHEQSFAEIVAGVVAIDKFIEVKRLLPFFSIEARQIMPQLLQMEVEKKIKLIDLLHLTVTSYSHFEELSGQLLAILQQAYDAREKSLKLSEIEKKIKVPASSLFFRYLLQSLYGRFEFRVMQNKLIMQKLPLSANEKERITDIIQAVRRQRLDLFSIDQLAKLLPFNFTQLNDTLWNMVNEGQIIQLGERYFIFSDDLQRIVNRLKKYKRNQGDLISIDSFRNLTGFSRKYIIVLFEYFDTQQYTQRVGNKRKILLTV